MFELSIIVVPILLIIAIVRWQRAENANGDLKDEIKYLQEQLDWYKTFYGTRPEATQQKDFFKNPIENQ